MKIKSKILSIAIAFLFFLFLLFVYPYYFDNRKIEKFKGKLNKEKINMQLEGFEFGITKDEFKNKYGNIFDSLIYVKNQSKYSKIKGIKSFHGLTVAKQDFVFFDNIFHRTFITTDIFTNVDIYVRGNDATLENFLKLKSEMDRYEQINFDKSENKDMKTMLYKYKANKILEIELGFYNRMFKGEDRADIIVSFGISRNLIENSNLLDF